MSRGRRDDLFVVVVVAICHCRSAPRALSARLCGAAQVFNEMRMHGVRPDAVTFTAMLTACAMKDELEQVSK